MRSLGNVRKAVRAGARFAVLVAVGALAGCGYSTQLAAPAGHRLIGVEIFANDSPVPDLERRMHAALTETVRAHVDGEVVRPSDASLVISGRIIEYGRRGGIRSADNEWLESAVLLTAEGLLGDDQGLVLSRTLVTVEVGFTFGVEGGEAAAAQRAVENLAERLVLELFAKAGARRS